MQTIRTKYIGPSNTKGSRIKADCEGGSVTIHIDNSKSIEENEKDACDKLKAKLEWSGEMVSGVFDGATYWVFLPRA